MKCVHCLLELLDHSTIVKGQRVDTFGTRDAITIVCGDACCEVHLAQAIVNYAKR